ncbi:MAG: EpsI family protein [Armatimonadetes bacterium]|nr:EpsI family protein [Armatimonadota bacterium]
MSRVQTHGIVLIFLIGLFTAVNVIGSKAKGKEPPQVEMATWVPLDISGWTGTNETPPSVWSEQLPHANFLVRYYTKGPAVVELLMIQSADPGSFHNPMFCLPGSGYNTIDSGVQSLPHGDVSQGEFSKSFEQLIVRYWYVAGPRQTPNLWNHKWNIFWNKISGNHGDNLSFRVTVRDAGGEDPGKVANDFSDLVLQEVQKKLTDGRVAVR